MKRPSAPPERCPVCGVTYGSVSRHGEDDGLVVNLRANQRYARVCFDPVTVEGAACVDFYHHTHDQAGREPDLDGETTVSPTDGRRDTGDGGDENANLQSE